MFEYGHSIMFSSIQTNRMHIFNCELDATATMKACNCLLKGIQSTRFCNIIFVCDWRGMGEGSKQQGKEYSKTTWFISSAQWHTTPTELGETKQCWYQCVYIRSFCVQLSEIESDGVTDESFGLVGRRGTQANKQWNNKTGQNQNGSPFESITTKLNE